MHRYEIIIFWSDEDDAFIADVPELSGCKAHGNSRKEALEKRPGCHPTMARYRAANSAIESRNPKAAD